MPFSLLVALFVLVLFVLLYLKAVRPQQQFLKDQQKVVASLAVGDRVISSAGIFGRITHLTPEVVTLEVAPGVELQVARPAIARRVDLDPGDPLGSQLVDLASSDDHPPVQTDAAADGPVTDDHPALRED